MSVIITILILFMAFFLFVKKEKRWIRHGKYVGSEHVTVNGHHYYIEEVKFRKYQEALHKFYKIVADISSYGKAIETKYDLYDWSYTIFRFPDTTIELKHLRSFNKVQLIKSIEPLTIEEFEKDKVGYKNY